ncbi:VOC family protein [Allosphingosinicella vermicomposti]|uniref:VOC family protein n=1 Tax=Allosphingosinicella vermicomposti TaxID=614671 RepID=UPI000D0FCEF3|nr:VOC family protein [Allosphingosinicella vermicomposti]
MAGQFIWHELVTTDVDGALGFYGDVVGWTYEEMDMGGPRYVVLSANGRAMGGVMPFPPEGAGMEPVWLGYVGVDDVDEEAARLERDRGTVHKSAADIPGIGRFAVVADPQGAVFVLFAGSDGNADPAPFMAPGHVGWNELHTIDWEKAFTFYSGHYGWTKDEAMDMGAMGTYQLFATGGAQATGAMMNNPNMPHPAWLFYFSVPDVDAGIDRIKAGGGTILMGPVEVPGGAWIVQAKDPRGAMFALVGMRPNFKGETA